ncbi:hypothetical protein ABMA27_010993 [Loxostege sticticalis]|uniref:CHK kinase-like domain-containing protein n=1 Tax=Loxostege sticticalis TaxID=481309 RepID=A0ABR3H3A8_LOXSC
MTDARENLLRDLLQKIATEQQYENPDIETAAIPTTGANFTSQLFHASLKSAGKADINVFAKVAVVNETMREQLGSNTIFEIEPHFYGKLAKAYKEIEDKHNVPEEFRLVVPKFYGHSGEYLKEVLVLQDLSKDGFVTYDRLKSVDWDYASKAVEELAKLHALSIAYQKEYPEDFEEDKKVLRRAKMDESSPMVEMFKQMIGQVIQMVREENRPKIMKFLTGSFDMQGFMEFYSPKKRPVIVHSDYRQSNLMHKIDEDGKLQVIIVDYQTLHPGSACLDLLYFIFTGSDGAFRAQYYDQLLNHYFENLTAALKRLDLDPEEAFPRSVFDEEMKEMLPFGLLIASMMLPLVTVELAELTKSGMAFENKSLEAMTDMLSVVNALCSQRFNEVVDDYVKWGVL